MGKLYTLDQKLLTNTPEIGLERKSIRSTTGRKQS